MLALLKSVIFVPAVHICLTSDLFLVPVKILMLRDKVSVNLGLSFST